MKKLLRFLFVPMIVFAAFTACDNDDEPEEEKASETFGAYFINYGNFNGGLSSVTKYNYETKELVNDYYKQQNGQELVSNIQYAYLYNDSVYMIGNSSDQLIETSKYFVQTKNGISEGLANPRFCVALGSKLYISCWGENPDYVTMPGSYIAVMDIKTGKIENRIAMPGGTEGMAIVDDKLYVAMNYQPYLGILSLSDYSTSYVKMPAVSSYFLKDQENNLYVSLVSTYSCPSETTGLGYFNTSKNKLEDVYLLNGMSSNYSSVITANSNFSKIYALTTIYGEDWSVTSEVYTFDVATKTFSQFASNLVGPMGLACNPDNNDLYIFGGESVIEDGYFSIYNEDGHWAETCTCGNSPYWVLFMD